MILCISKDTLVVRVKDPVAAIACYTHSGWKEVETLQDGENYIMTFGKWSWCDFNSDYITKYSDLW